jgi:hypothetical protein
LDGEPDAEHRHLVLVQRLESVFNFNHFRLNQCHSRDIHFFRIQQEHSTTMKHRITFIQSEGTGIDPGGIHVNPDTVVFNQAHNTALEKKVTLGLSDLPAEVSMFRCYYSINWSEDNKCRFPRSPQSWNNATNYTFAGLHLTTTLSQRRSPHVYPQACTCSSRRSKQARKSIYAHSSISSSARSWNATPRLSLSPVRPRSRRLSLPRQATNTSTCSPA